MKLPKFHELGRLGSHSIRFLLQLIGTSNVVRNHLFLYCLRCLPNAGFLIMQLSQQRSDMEPR